jgi:putative ABC transport system substrate-binding protein
VETNKNNKLSIIINQYSLILVILLLSLITYLNPTIAEDKKIIAITQIVEHQSLAEAKRGIIDELAAKGYVVGENLEIIDKNAGGSIATSVLIAKQFAAAKPDVIVPISTPSAQSVISVLKQQNEDIPVVFSSVTDPVSAGLVGDMVKPVKNITGAIDFPLIKEEVDLIKTLVPYVKKLGLLYSSGEANSVKTIALMKVELAKANIEYVEVNVANSAGVAQGLISLVGKVDGVYIPSDNVVFSAMAKLVQLSRNHKLPVFSSDPDSVQAGVTACVGYSQYMVGRKAGELVVKILQGERYIPISKPAKAEIFINEESAKIMNIKETTGANK